MADKKSTPPEDIWDAVRDESLGKATLALRISHNEQILQTIRLAPDVTYIGRMPENHVVVDDAKASRSHAVITFKEDHYVLEDQESENGTYVNGNKISVVPLSVGDQIRIGSHLLEVMEAGTDIRSIPRESQLDQAEEEEWRLDRTVSMTPEQIQKKLQERRMKERRQEASKPKMKLSLEAGDSKYEKEVVFESARKRENHAGKGNFIQVRVELGKWILEKKVPL